MELPKASCKPCAKITHHFEYTCCRQIFGKFRIRHNLPTRRKKERPTHLTAMATTEGNAPRSVVLAAAEYPTELFMYKFGKANALMGMPAHVNTFEWVPYGITDNAEMKAFEQKHGGNFTTQVKLQPVELGRMLAKIGHSFAVATVGFDAFRPLALDLILGRTDNVSHTVGSISEIQPTVPDAGHVLSLEYHVEPFKKRALLIAGIRLFASIQTPSYHVVVGDVQTSQHVRVLFEKFSNAQSIEVSYPLGQVVP